MTINNTRGVTPMNNISPFENSNVVDLNERVSDASNITSMSHTQLSPRDIDNFYQRIQSSSLTLQGLTDELNNMALDGKWISLQQQQELISACLTRAKNEHSETSSIYSLLNEKFINVIAMRGLMNSYMGDIFSSKSGNPMIDEALEDEANKGV